MTNPITVRVVVTFHRGCKDHGQRHEENGNKLHGEGGCWRIVFLKRAETVEMEVDREISL